MAARNVAAGPADGLEPRELAAVLLVAELAPVAPLVPLDVGQAAAAACGAQGVVHGHYARGMGGTANKSVTDFFGRLGRQKHSSGGFPFMSP